MRLFHRMDWILAGSIVGLMTISLLMIFSTTGQVGLEQFNDSLFYVKKHSVYVTMALIFMVVSSRIPISFYQRFAGLGYLVSVILVGLPLVPGLKLEAGGATRWVQLGPIHFQPVEATKFFLALAFAMFLSRKAAEIAKGNLIKGVLPFVSITILPISLLFFHPDLGNIGLILMMMMTLILVAGLPMRQCLIFLALIVGLVSYSIATHPYQMDRVTAFLDPWEDPLGKNYHVIQSYTAIGSGGIFGVGIGKSQLQYFYLPHHHSDFIFSVICEELGLMGSALVLFLFALFLTQTVKVIMRLQDPFMFYFAIGILNLLIYQALINMMVVVGLFPVKGIPLTFMSYGGTSLMISGYLVGILLQIAKR